MNINFWNTKISRFTVCLLFCIDRPDKVKNESTMFYSPCKINVSWIPPLSLKPLDQYRVFFNEETKSITENYILLPVENYNLSIIAVNKLGNGPAVNMTIHKSDIG